MGKIIFNAQEQSYFLVPPCSKTSILSTATITACFESGATHWQCQVGEERRHPRTDVTAMAGEALEGVVKHDA